MKTSDMGIIAIVIGAILIGGVSIGALCGAWRQEQVDNAKCPDPPPVCGVCVCPPEGASR